MTLFKFMLCAAVASLTFGLAWPDLELAGGRAPFPQDYMVLAVDETTQQRQVQSEDNADESAKMGKDAGTQTGSGEMPEDKTEKIDQPPRIAPR